MDSETIKKTLFTEWINLGNKIKKTDKFIEAVINKLDLIGLDIIYNKKNFTINNCITFIMEKDLIDESNLFTFNKYKSQYESKKIFNVAGINIIIKKVKDINLYSFKYSRITNSKEGKLIIIPANKICNISFKKSNTQVLNKSTNYETNINDEN